MLSPEQNRILTSVEPGTPMNAALKRYWMPVARCADHAGSASDPVRLTALSEDYVLFRDSAGVLGLLKEQCCHRGASLVLGRAEGDGIRCLFHGWKYAVDGRVLDMPNCNDAKVMARIRQRSFPVREAGGLIWAYFGPPEHEPPFPKMPFFDLPDEHRYIEAPVGNANFVQLLEGLFDSTHVGILHSTRLNQRLNPMLTPGIGTLYHRQMLTQRAPEIGTADADFGFRFFAIRDEYDDDRLMLIARINAFALPFLGFIASGWTMVAALPVTSTRTVFFHVFWDPKQPLVGDHLQQLRDYYGLNDKALYEWGLADSARDLPTAAHRRNNFHQDREAMRRDESFTGIFNFVPEDIAMAESQGPIYDRSEENLIAADAGVSRLRRVLLDAADAVQDGREPLGVRGTEMPYGIQGAVASAADWPSLLRPLEPAQHA